jgi:ribosomal protein S18
VRGERITGTRDENQRDVSENQRDVRVRGER